jgi:hypothetical protein
MHGSFGVMHDAALSRNRFGTGGLGYFSMLGQRIAARSSDARDAHPNTSRDNCLWRRPNRNLQMRIF